MMIFSLAVFSLLAAAVLPNILKIRGRWNLTQGVMLSGEGAIFAVTFGCLVGLTGKFEHTERVVQGSVYDLSEELQSYGISGCQDFQNNSSSEPFEFAHCSVQSGKNISAQNHGSIQSSKNVSAQNHVKVVSGIQPDNDRKEEEPDYQRQGSSGGIPLAAFVKKMKRRSVKPYSAGVSVQIPAEVSSRTRPREKRAVGGGFLVSDEGGASRPEKYDIRAHTAIINNTGTVNITN